MSAALWPRFALWAERIAQILTVVFCFTMTGEIASSVLHAPHDKLPTKGSDAASCEATMRQMNLSLEAATARALNFRTEHQALDSLRRDLAPLDAAQAELAEACAATPERIAAFGRLRYAQEARVRRDAALLLPLRRKAGL